MENAENNNLPSKLENSFLGILRIVILVVLTVSLIGALIFGFMGLSNLNASPAKYEYKNPNIKEMVIEIKKSLEEKPTPSNTDEPKKDEPKKNEKLEKEIDKQMKLVSDLLQRYKKNLSNPELFRDGLKQRAENLAFDPKNESSVLKYAEGQTELFQIVFTDKDILATLDKQEEKFGRFFETALRTYPNYFRKQQDEKKKFEMEQAAEVIEQKASAALYLYIAAGKFLTFLLISLILVLVKIERNLRVRPV
jgi:hypothetical protein